MAQVFNFGDTQIFNHVGMRIWRGEGLGVVNRHAKAFLGVKEIVIQRLFIHKVTDPEVKIKISFNNGWRAYTTGFSFTNSKIWAEARSADKRSAFYQCSVNIINEG